MVRAWKQQGEALLQDIAAAVPDREQLACWCLGQVGYVFKKGVTVAVDPVLNDITGEDGQTRRLYQPPFSADALHVDYVLCTHGHDDHMALPTLTAMATAFADTLFLVPGGCLETLASAGVPRERILPMQAGVEVILPGLTVRPVQAAHPVHEVDARGRDLALCLNLELDGFEVLHLGDTYLTDQLLADLQRLPKPDATFLPINGGDYFRTARNCIGNLNPLEAARLSVLLGAAVSVPTHFDMMMGNTADPLEFVRCLWQEDPAAAFRIPALGERLELRKA